MTSCDTETYRTKVLKLLPEQDKMFLEPLERLISEESTVEQYQQQTIHLLRSIDLHTEFSSALNLVRGCNKAEWLVRRHIGKRRYTVQIYGVEAGQSHPPHDHHNLISTQMILEGSIHLRAYDRVKCNSRGQLILRLVRDEILGPGDVFQVSEWNSNAHWFGATNQSAVIFSVDARGFEKETFDAPDNQDYGRRYLDPTAFNCHDLIVCNRLDKEEAMQRFAHRPLSDFSLPAFDNRK